MKKILFLALVALFALPSMGFVAVKSPAAIGKSLAFPVWGKRSKVGSFWGDERDGGARSHEGIDIFARKGTPVVAIADGVIEERATTPRGGKILWLRTDGQPWSVYYAHLDKQLVREGQRVKKGQMLGTVGNTGNARTTPAHLHFGIYTWRGAVNPYPYVKHSKKVTTPVGTSKKKATAKKRGTKKSVTKKSATSKSSTVKKTVARKSSRSTAKRK